MGGNDGKKCGICGEDEAMIFEMVFFREIVVEISYPLCYSRDTKRNNRPQGVDRL